MFREGRRTALPRRLSEDWDALRCTKESNDDTRYWKKHGIKRKMEEYKLNEENVTIVKTVNDVINFGGNAAVAIRVKQFYFL